MILQLTATRSTARRFFAHHCGLVTKCPTTSFVLQIDREVIQSFLPSYPESHLIYDSDAKAANSRQLLIRKLSQNPMLSANLRGRSSPWQCCHHLAHQLQTRRDAGVSRVSRYFYQGRSDGRTEGSALLAFVFECPFVPPVVRSSVKRSIAFPN